MNTDKESIINAIDGFLEELKTLADRAHREYKITKGVNIEQEKFDRLENKIFKFLKKYISQVEAQRFNRKLHPGILGVSFDAWVDFVDHDLKPAISYLEGLRHAIESEDKDLIFKMDNKKKIPNYKDLAYFTFLLHPEILKVAKSRFNSGHYADAVESAFKLINNTVKEIVKTTTGEELDGAKLMYKAFSPRNPIIVLGDLSTETGKNIQEGYMHIFAGAMMGIRNPKAHNNIEIDAKRAIHFLLLASLLRYKIDEKL